MTTRPVVDASRGMDTGDRVVRAAAASRRFGAWYVAEHRFRVMRSYLQTVIATGIGTPILYLPALGLGLGGLVSGNLGPRAVDGVSYLVFVAPALLVMAAVTTAMEEFSYPVMLGFKWNPIFFGMNATPISPGQIIDGILISVTGRLVITCGIYAAFMAVFGALPGPAGILVVPIALLAGLAFGAPVMAFVATIVTDRGQIPMIARFVLLPLTLFSGTFFPLSTLPVFLQWIGWVSPVWHGVELGRVASYGHVEPIWLTIVHIAYLSALVIVCRLLARRTATRRLGR